MGLLLSYKLFSQETVTFLDAIFTSSGKPGGLGTSVDEQTMTLLIKDLFKYGIKLFIWNQRKTNVTVQIYKSTFGCNIG